MVEPGLTPSTGSTSTCSATGFSSIQTIGYHVRDYFLKQWDRFQGIPGCILAHSTHVKGTGTYDEALGIETPRITVTLATGIAEERCRLINLGYADYREIDPAAWRGREEEGILFVPHAGEMLYRAHGRAKKEFPPMTNENARLSALRKLVDDDAVGQLRRRDGLMATLGNEDGALNLDWVEGVARLLADPAAQNEIVRKIAEAKQASWGAIPLHFCMPRR